MKFLLYLLSSLLIATGCGPDVTAETAKPSVDKQTIAFTAEGGEQIVTVTSSKAVSVLFSEDWITIATGKKNSENKTPVTVTVQKNYVAEARTARLTVVSGDEKIYVTVNQQAGTGTSQPGNGEMTGNLVANLNDWFGIGWNLGNHFDGFNNGVAGETAWGNPKATQATFIKVKEAGFTTVRIPVTWLGKVGAAPDYKIDEAWLNRVAEVVGYAEAAGLKAIINIHHDGSESKYWLDIINAAKDAEVHKRILAQTTAMWTQIAEKFKDKGDFLVFEAFNEVHDGKWGWGTNRTDGGKQYKCLNEWNQAFVDAVRAVGGKNSDRILGVPAYCTNVDIAIESFVMPKDSAKDRLMLSVHCYDPSEYTLTAKYSEWGHTAESSKKASGDNEAALKKVFEKIQKNFLAKGIPVYMGEFGCVNRASERDQKFQQYYLAYYAKLAKTYGVPVILWDNGAKGAGNERHAFIDHATGEYCSPEAKAAVEAMLDSYTNQLTLDQVYKNAPK